MQVFAVDEKPPDYSTGAATSAAEYLRRVRCEAAQTPEVTCIKPSEIPGYAACPADDDIQKRTLCPKDDIAQPPKWYEENENWADRLVDWFGHLREQIAEHKSEMVGTNAPHSNDEEGWKRFCFGERGKGMAKVVAMDRVQISTALSYFAKWLEELASNDEERANNEEDQGGVAERMVSGHRSHWLFAFLLCIQRPLLQEDAATLRSILKALAAARATIESQNDALFAPLTVLIIILSRYFGQGG